MARLATSSDQREMKNGILIPKNMKESTVSPDGTAVDTTSDKVEQIIRAILDEGRSKEERQELLEAFLKKVDTEMSEAKTQMSEKRKEDQKLQAEKDKKIADLMAALNDTKKEKDGEIANLKAKRTKERDEIAKEFREYKKRGAQKAEQAAESKYKAAFEKAEAQRNAKLKKKLEEIELRGPNPKLRDFLPFSEVRALRKIDDQIIKCKQEHPEEYPSNAITYLSKMTQSRGGKRVLKIAKENQLKGGNIFANHTIGEHLQAIEERCTISEKDSRYKAGLKAHILRHLDNIRSDYLAKVQADLYRNKTRK